MLPRYLLTHTQNARQARKGTLFLSVCAGTLLRWVYVSMCVCVCARACVSTTFHHLALSLRDCCYVLNCSIVEKQRRILETTKKDESYLTCTHFADATKRTPLAEAKQSARTESGLF